MRQDIFIMTCKLNISYICGGCQIEDIKSGRDVYKRQITRTGIKPKNCLVAFLPNYRKQTIFADMMDIRFATKKDIPAIKELFRSTILSVNLKDYTPEQVGC